MFFPVFCFVKIPLLGVQFDVSSGCQYSGPRPPTHWREILDSIESTRFCIPRVQIDHAAPENRRGLKAFGWPCKGLWFASGTPCNGISHPNGPACHMCSLAGKRLGEALGVMIGAGVELVAVWRFPTAWVPPVIIHFKEIFPHKPSIYWGTTHFRKPPFVT